MQLLEICCEFNVLVRRSLVWNKLRYGPWVLWDPSDIEVEKISEDLSGTVTKLRKGIATRLLVHVFPRILLENSSSLTNLSDETECIGLKVAHDVFHVTVSILVAEGSDVPESLSEKAVFVV